jgi:HEAT repeat protein
MKKKTIPIDQLLNHLADGDAPLAVAQLYRLSDLFGAELARFRQVWPKISQARRRQVMGFLVEIAETNFEVDLEAVFLIGIQDADGEVRARAVEGLWDSQDPALVSPLLKMAREDPSEQVRAAAVKLLGRFVLLGELGRLSAAQQSAIEEILLTLIRSPEKSLEVRRRAIESLACSGRQEVPGIVENAYYHPDRRMRVAAIYAMGRTLDPQWEPLLLEELQSHDAECRYEAARACGELGLTSAVARLAELLSDDDREIQETSIWALGQVGGDRAKRALEEHYEVVDPGDTLLREAIEDALSDLALAAGAAQFPLYDFASDLAEEGVGWGEDWIDGVLDRRIDEWVDDSSEDA